MIKKAFEINKKNLTNNKFFLFYGLNEGAKKQKILEILYDFQKEYIQNYEEKQILESETTFFDNIFTKSFFEKEKVIIINRASEKILKIIEEILEKKIEDLFIIINCNLLDKKSKLRTFFEKNRNTICVPFYPDTHQVLSKLANDFFREKNISISQANINLIVNKCNGDRENLLNELKKIEYYNKNGKKISTENITKLTNLAENYSITELINNCLAKNSNKIINILNENNFNSDDCVLIARVFLSQSKKILKLACEFEINKNIDLTISSAKPPIFWKDKEITKQQIYKWTPKNIKQLIYNLCEIELLIKKNIGNSLNIITDFILAQSTSKTNN